MSDTKNRLRRTVVNALQLDRDPVSIPDHDLRVALDLDSIAVLELLIWVENEFEIQIEDDDLNMALLDSLDTLADYVDARLFARGGSA